MVHFQDQLADLGLEFLVVGLQLTFSLRRFLDKAVALILLTPPFDQASGDLIVSCCLRRAQLPGLDLFDQLAFEGGLEPTIVSFSHFSISNSLTARIQRRAQRAVESAASVEIRKNRGFPHDAWKSLAQNSSAFPHLPQPRRLRPTCPLRSLKPIHLS